MLRESNYNLGYLSHKYLNKNLNEIDMNVILTNLHDPKFFAELGELTLYESSLTFDLIDKFCILQFRQNIF